MDDLSPMRPVSVPPDEFRATPIWQLAAVLLFVGVAGGVSVWLDGGQWWAVAVTALMMLAGVVVAGLASARVQRENRGVRIPLFLGSPKVRPRKYDLLNGVGPALAMVGAIGLGRNLSVPWPLPILVVAVALIVVPMMSIHLHNRRLTTISDA